MSPAETALRVDPAPITVRTQPLWPRLAGPLVAGLFGLVLYFFTAAPTVLWGDDAELQRIVVAGGQRTIGQSSRASHLLWLALAGPFVQATAWLPRDAAGRTVLVAALAGAATLPFVYLAAAELARSWPGRARWAGLLAAGTFGLSHTFWLLAVRPTAYTLSTVLLALCTVAVLRWRVAAQPLWLAGAALALALALTNHVLVLASVPGLLALALAVPPGARRRLGLALAVAAILGALVLVVATLLGLPLGDLVRVVAGYRPYRPPLRDVVLVPVYLAYQFPLALPLAAWGGYRLWQADRGAAAGLAVLYAGNMLLVLLQHQPGITLRDQFIYFLPSYFPVALLIGVGGAALLARPGAGAAPASTVSAMRRRLSRTLGRPVVLAGIVLAPLLVYPLAAQVAGALATRLAPARRLPGRDPVAFYLFPGKGGYDGARSYADAAMTSMAPGAAVVADWLPYQTLRYLQEVEGQRPDVLLAQINAGEGAQLPFLLRQGASRPLYLADAAPAPYYDLAEIETCFTLTEQGPVYRLVPRLPPGAGCS